MSASDRRARPGEETFPRVTVVTPSYEQAAYLDQTLRSVLEQNYPNLEYFVVDGGSTDGSVDVIRKRESALSWWVSEPDRGHAHAVNKGWARSTGEILAFLNSDDVYLPGAIASAVDFLVRHPDVDIVHTNALHITEDGTVFNVNVPPPFSVRRMLESCFITQPTVFLRRTVFERLGGLTEDFSHSLDYEYWLRAVPTTHFGYLPRYTAAARYHAAAKSTGGYNEFARDEVRLFDELFSRREPRFAGAHLERMAYLPRLTYMAARHSGYADEEKTQAVERLKWLDPPPTAEEIAVQVRDNRMYLGTPYRPLDPTGPLASRAREPDPYMIVDGLLGASVIDARTAHFALELAKDVHPGGVLALGRSLMGEPRTAFRASWWLAAATRAAPRPIRRAARFAMRRAPHGPAHTLVGLSLEEACARQGLTGATQRSGRNKV